MNVQLIDGSGYIDQKQGFTYDKGFGRIRNLNFTIMSGEMANPEEFRGQATVSIAFYNDKAAMIGGKQDLYTISMVFNNLELLQILDIDETLGYSISEKKIYDYFLTLPEYLSIFEYVPVAE